MLARDMKLYIWSLLIIKKNVLACMHKKIVHSYTILLIIPHKKTHITHKKFVIYSTLKKMCYVQGTKVILSLCGMY